MQQGHKGHGGMSRDMMRRHTRAGQLMKEGKQKMIRYSKRAFVLVVAGGLVACGGAVDDQANDSGAGTETANMTAEAPNAFADSEQRMNNAMMAAVGTDAGDSWAKKMIAHHQGAIDMSEIVLRQNPLADVGEMARMTIEKQGEEIGDIRKLVKDGAPNQQSADLYRSSMMDMHQKMQAATGADVSETFMRKMLEHHRGGVVMSDMALQNGVTGALREQVQKTRDDQQKEARMVEAMLRGETMQHAMQESGAKSAEQAKAEPAPAEKARVAPKAEPKSIPKASPAATTKPALAPDPHAGHDMNKM